MTAGLGVVLAAGLLLWWLGSRQRRGARRGPIFAMAVLLVLGLGVLALPDQEGAAAKAGTQAAIPFDEAKLSALRAQGRPVFLYFTADWCITCKANEATAIHTDAVSEAFRKAGVTVMIGDWTNGDAAIGRFLARHDRSGVPLYLWYAPGKETQLLPQILTPSLLAGLPR
jgi:thiol:disulfide interchange protein